MTLVRSARVADIQFIVQANVAMAAETEDKGLNAEVLERGIEYLFKHPAEGQYLVAAPGTDDASNTLAGTLMLTYEWSDWRNGRFWWIQSVYVMPEFRRQGVYRAMHDQVLALAREDALSCGVRLYVERENRIAQQTYRSLGMVETDYRLFETTF